MEFGAAVGGVGANLGGLPTCTVIGFRDRLPAAWAALVNGNRCAHGLDYDDTHTESVVHVSASVVPASLAACRGGECCGHERHRRDISGDTGRPGWRRTSASAWWPAVAFTIGGFIPRAFAEPLRARSWPVRLPACHRRSLPTRSALPAALAAGSLEFSPPTARRRKRLHAGWAAHSGVVAARLAAAGFSGPRGTLDGRFGSRTAAISASSGWDIEALTDGLGSRSGATRRPASGRTRAANFNHAFIDCAAVLRATVLRTAYMLEPDAIEEIECFISRRARCR